MNNETQSSRFRLGSKIASVFLTTALLASTFTGLGGTIASAAAVEEIPALEAPTVAAPGAGALPENIYDGVILHAWNWSFSAIKDNMAAIAKAGYTSVQTSPVQRPKEYSNTGTTQWDWWKVYQPTSLSFSPGGHPWFGSKEDFKAMCDEADKYGIKIIVDIVANHMANTTGGYGNTRQDICEQNEAEYRDDDSCWHLNGSRGINYGQQNRNGGTDSLTYGFGGWPDLNTGNKKVQNAIINLLKECYDLGADGFRFDAAKHIELPTDPGGASDFWPTVINGIESYANSKGHPVYCYGEILDDSATDIKNYTKYIAVTDNRAGNSTRYGVRDGDIGKAANSSLNYNGVPYNKIVLWSESHDTYANDDYTGESTKFNQDQIDRAWAVIAARQFPALYFVRPDNPRSQKMGQMSQNYAWKSTEVAAVNRFHNAFVGESEYMSSSGNTVIVERGTSGCVLVNIGGNGGQFSGKVNKMKDGTYVDQVTQGTFTVSGGQISGNIGSKGIAVVYDASDIPSYGSVSATPGDTSFFSETLSVTLKASNVTGATYTTSEGDSGSFTDGQKITIGAKTAKGSAITLNLSGTKEDGSQTTAKYTYIKKDESDVTTVYFDNSSYKWGNVYAYIYKDSGGTSGGGGGGGGNTPVPSGSILFTNSLDWGSVKAYFFNDSGTVGADWPGTDMSPAGDNGFGKTNFSASIPSGATKVIFHNGSGTQTGDLPLAGVAGYWLDGSPDNAKSWSASPSAAPAADPGAVTANAEWPGQKMNEGGPNGYYYLQVPAGLEDGRVIFSDGVKDTTNRYPANMEPGLAINDTSMLFSEGNSWKPYTKPVPTKLTVSLSASPSTVKVGDTVTLTATPSNASGTVTYSYKAGSETLSATGATATWTAKAAGSVTFTVTARDSANTATATATVTVESGPVEGPQVICDKASGTSFETETLSVNLTLKNAVSGTYSIDGGAVKKFTGPTTVAVGEGKIGDTTVTLTATATGSNGKTNTQTFTFSKKYKVKTTSSSAPSTCDKFVTNPNGAVGAKKTITSASDFTADTMIAKGIANDDPAAFKGPHEAPKFDLYALYAAWDDTNLYIGIQYTNVIDVVAPEQDAPQGGRGKPNGADADIPQMILLDVKSGDYTDGSTNDTTQKTVWNSNITFGGNTKVDRVIMYSPKDGINNWGVFPVKNGVIDYTSDQTYTPGYQKALAGASLTWEDGFFLDKMEGIDNNGHKGYTPAEIESTSSKWVDFLTTGHSKAQDTFCIMTMPLKYLGISANDISSNGIGVMAVATYGASGIGCLPYDDVMLDAATEEYSSDPSTSHEKEDADQITVALASVGKGGNNPPPPPPSTPLQVNFGTDKAAPQLPTTKMTIKGIGIGGTAPYKYEFRINGKTVQASSSADTYSWTPGTVAKYTLECVVTDSTGKTSTSTKTFTAANSDGDTPPPPPDGLTASISLSATSVKVGTSVKITAGASGGSAPYQYAYFQKLSTASAYSTIKSYSTATTATFTPKKAGTYTIKVKVKDSDGTVKSAVKTLKVTSTPTTLTNKSTLSASMVKLGGTVTVNCAASGGTTPYQYAVFYKKSSSSKYTTVQSYKTNKTVTIKPGAPTVYNIRVKVKDAKDTVKVLDFDLTVTNPEDVNALKNTSKVSATSVTLGESVIITGSATGGKSPYKFASYYKKSGAASFTKIRDYSTTAIMAFKPSSVGTYTVRVKVKDAKAKVVNKDITVKVVPAPLTNKSTVSATTVTLGKSITITGTAAGGTSPYKYAAYYKKSSATSYTTLRGFSTTRTMTYKPAALATYNLKVKVKDNTGKIVSKDFTIKVTAAALANTSKVSATSVTLGKSVTITGSATGGATPYKYAAYYKLSGASTFTKLRDFSTTATMTFKPAKIGSYTLRIKVKDAKGAVVSKDITVKAVAGALANTSKLSATSIALGSKLTVTGSATGGTAPYQYAVYYKKAASSSYTKVRGYSTTNTISVTPASATKYDVRVKVKDKTGKVVNKDFVVTVSKTSVNTALSNNSRVSSAKIKLGETVRVTCVAAGGTAPYKYAVSYKKASGTDYTSVQSYSTNKSVTIKPAAATTYVIRVKVKDAKGTLKTKEMKVAVTK